MKTIIFILTFSIFTILIATGQDILITGGQDFLLINKQDSMVVKRQDKLLIKELKNPKFSLHLRQSFQSEDSKPEPATFTYTKPKEGKESFLIDAALGLKINSKENSAFYLYGEYHRNTLIDKEQNTIQSGLDVEWYTNRTFNNNEDKRNMSTAIININGKYSKDIVDTTHSLQITAEITPLFLRGNKTRAFLPNDNHNHIGSAFDLLYFPALGFENQYTFQAKNDSAKGNTFRGLAKIYIAIKPIPLLFKSKIELFGDFTKSYDFLNSTKYNERNHGLLKAGINFIIFETGTKYAKIGASFNKGSDPAQGLKSQEYYLISLKVKL